MFDEHAPVGVAPHDPPPSSSVTWRMKVLLLIVVACHVVVVWSGRIPGVLTRGDDAEYIALGEALSHGSYRELWRADAPVHAQYPPGYPALLALWAALAGPSQTARMVLSVLISIATLLVLHSAIRRRLGPAIAVASVIVLAINPFIVKYSGEVASELPYTFLSVVCLYGLIRWEDERSHRGGANAWLVVAIAAMLGAALIRTIGIALIAAVISWLLLDRRWRIAAAVSVAAAATFGVWLLWTVLAPEQFVGRSYVADVMVNPGGRPFLMTIFARIVANTLAYVQGIPWALAVPTIQGTIADNIVGLLIVGITLMAGFWVLWRQWRQQALYAVTYGLVLLVFAWHATRFLIPMLVLMVPCVLVGALSIARSFRPRWANATLGVFVLLLTGGGALRSAELVASNNCPRTEGIPVAECAWWPEQARYFDALRFIQAKLPKDAVILTAKSGALYYYTGHKSISFAGARVQHPDNFVAWLKTQGASHILLTSLADPERRLLPSLHANCRQMRVVTSYTPTTLLLAIDAQVDAASSENDPEGDACAAVDSYQALMRVWDVEE